MGRRDTLTQRLSAVFGGGLGVDGTVWLTGTASLFVVQPRGFLNACDNRLSTLSHTAGMNALLGPDR